MDPLMVFQEGKAGWLLSNQQLFKERKKIFLACIDQLKKITGAVRTL